MKSHATSIFVVFLTCGTIYIDLAAQTIPHTEYRFKHYSKKDGLLNDFADRLKQDSLGFIWIQYYGGLSRFDGYSFKTYKYDAEDSLTAALILPLGFILKDASDEISIPDRRPSSPGGKRRLMRYDRKTDGFIKYEVDVRDIPLLEWLYEKNRKMVWIGTYQKGLFSYNFNNGETINYRNASTDGKSVQAPFSVGDLVHFDDLLLLATEKGLWLFDKKLKSFHRPKWNPRDTALLYNAPVRKFIGNPDVHAGNFWIITDRNFLKIDSTFSVVQKLNFPEGSSPANVSCDSQGILWYPSLWGSNDGLFRFDTRDTSFMKIKNDPHDPGSIASNMVYDVLVDSEQNVWVGTDRGVSVLQKQELNVYNKKLESGTIWASLVYKTKDAEYLIFSKWPSATKKLEIARIDHVTPGKLNFQPFLNPVEQQVIKMRKGSQYFWVVPFGGGIIGYPIDQQSGMIIENSPISLKHDPENPNTISSDVITNVWEDKNKNLWVVTQIHGMDRIRLDIPYGTKGSVVRYGRTLNGHHPYPEDDQSFWIMTNTAVILFRHSEDPTDTVKVDTVIESLQTPSAIYKSKGGTIYLGTFNGLYAIRKEGKNSYILNKTPIIKKAEITSLTEDGSGRLWLHSDNRIVCLDTRDTTVTVLGEDNGIDHLRGIEERDWLHQTSEGTLVIPGPDGFSFIDPASFQINRRKLFPVLTKLEINNIALTGTSIPGDPDFKSASDISILKKLVLDHYHNNFAIEFSAMEMNSPEKNLYRHKLEGFDQGWIETDAKTRTATYTNLDAGNYIFKVRASNHHGIWSDQETTLSIVILPPPWKTWWAYSLYGMLLIGLFFYWRNYENKRLKLKHRAEHLSELDTIKTRFFANISHEFRTPISLILGPLKEVYNKTTDPDEKSTFGRDDPERTTSLEADQPTFRPQQTRGR